MYRCVADLLGLREKNGWRCPKPHGFDQRASLHSLGTENKQISYLYFYFVLCVSPAIGLTSCQNTPAAQSPNNGEGFNLARWCRDYLLLRGVVDEADALGDVVLQALDSNLEECLLLGCDVGEDIDSLLGTVGLDRVSLIQPSAD